MKKEVPNSVRGRDTISEVSEVSEVSRDIKALTC